MKFLLSGLLSALLLPGIARAADSRKFEQGLRYEQAGLWQQAADAFSASIDAAPSAPAYLHRAKARLALDQTQTAVADLDQALLLNPEDAESFSPSRRDVCAARRPSEGRRRSDASHRTWKRGFRRVRRARRVRGAASRTSARGGRLFEGHSPAAGRSGAVEGTGNRAHRTGTLQRRHRRLRPSHPPEAGRDRSISRRGFAYGEVGEFDFAIDDFDRVLRLDRDNVRALTLRAAAWAKKDDYAKSIDDFTSAIRLAPGDATLLLARSSVYAAEGEHRKALADRDQAVRLRPDWPEALVARGGSYHELGMHEQGLADRTEAIRLAPGMAEAWCARGSAYFLLGKFENAVQDLKEAVRLNPNYTEAKIVLVKARQALESEAKTDEIHELPPRHHPNARWPRSPSHCPKPLHP